MFEAEKEGGFYNVNPVADYRAYVEELGKWIEIDELYEKALDGASMVYCFMKIDSSGTEPELRREVLFGHSLEDQAYELLNLRGEPVMKMKSGEVMDHDDFDKKESAMVMPIAEKVSDKWKPISPCEALWAKFLHKRKAVSEKCVEIQRKISELNI